MILKNKIALVTGASQGIGRATALVLAEAGAHIVAAARSVDKLEALAKEITALGRECLPVKCDVAALDEVKAAFAEAIKKFSRVDILVNNAGIVRDGLAMRMKKEDWDAVVQTNLTGAFYCIQEALKIMLKQRGGRIINITSVVAESGNAGQANYVSAKAGLIGLTKAIAQEIASRNITVNAVAPGYIETAMTSALEAPLKEKLLEKIPLGRIGSDRDVAYAVKFLASDEAAYITGHVLDVNGGMYM